MNNYELLYILPSTMTGAEIKTTFLEIEKEIEKLGAKKLQTLLDHPFLLKTEVSKEEAEELNDLPVIKKRLAYPIEKNRFGFYCLFNFSSDGKVIQELDTYLRLNNIILRHIIVQEDPMNKDELKQLQKLFARKKAEQDKEEMAILKEKEKKTETVKEEEVKKVETPKKKIENIKTSEEKELTEDKKVSENKGKEKELIEDEKVSEDEIIEKLEDPKEETKKVKTSEKKTEKKKEKETTTKKKKIKLEDLEDKLDEILEDTMI